MGVTEMTVDPITFWQEAQVSSPELFGKSSKDLPEKRLTFCYSSGLALSLEPIKGQQTKGE